MVFNSKEYEFSDITAVMAGAVISKLRGVKYQKDQEKEALYATGNKPVSIQRGNKSYSGTVSLLQSELEALEHAAGGDALDVQVDLIVTYGNPVKGDVIQTDYIQGLEFTSVPKGMSQGDKFAEIELPFIALDIRNGYV